MCSRKVNFFFVFAVSAVYWKAYTYTLCIVKVRVYLWQLSVFKQFFFIFLVYVYRIVYFCVTFFVTIFYLDRHIPLHRHQVSVAWKFFILSYVQWFFQWKPQGESSSCTHTSTHIFFVLCIDNVIGSSVTKICVCVRHYIRAFWKIIEMPVT